MNGGINRGINCKMSISLCCWTQFDTRTLAAGIYFRLWPQIWWYCWGGEITKQKTTEPCDLQHMVMRVWMTHNMWIWILHAFVQFSVWNLINSKSFRHFHMNHYFTWINSVLQPLSKQKRINRITLIGCVNCRISRNYPKHNYCL